ncbi:hypothetical protein [Streptomyces sp. R35]|uniref:DUF3099 domain-containing protein n=1 Tax=Streptomyces sp. R35 TaxID=3238630 RepID=A0AB39S4R6_9ACTN
MRPTSAERTDERPKFTSVARHVARRPLLMLWLVAVAVGVTVLRSRIPEPWSGLALLPAMPLGVWSISRSYYGTRRQPPTKGTSQ